MWENSVYKKSYAFWIWVDNVFQVVLISYYMINNFFVTSHVIHSILYTLPHYMLYYFLGFFFSDWQMIYNDQFAVDNILCNMLYYMFNKIFLTLYAKGYVTHGMLCYMVYGILNTIYYMLKFTSLPFNSLRNQMDIPTTRMSASQCWGGIGFVDAYSIYTTWRFILFLPKLPSHSLQSVQAAQAVGTNNLLQGLAALALCCLLSHAGASIRQSYTIPSGESCDTGTAIAIKNIVQMYQNWDEAHHT